MQTSLLEDTTAEVAPPQLGISVVVPVLDEADSLPELLNEIERGIAATGKSYEVILVDDGSTDATWQTIRESASDSSGRIVGLRFKRNYGKSAALAAGFKRTRGQYVITMDADLQDDPAEIPALIEQLDAGYDLVSGWKRDRKDPLSKTVPSRFFNYVTRKLSGIPLHDFNCGLKAYKHSVTSDLLLYGEMHRYIPLLAKWEGFENITEIVVNHRPRKYGATKFGLERLIRGFLDLITVLFITRFAARPMHFFGSLGTLSFTGGFLISLYLSIDKLILGNPIGDRPLLLFGAILIIVGSQLFMSGILGEMLIRQRVEAHGSYHIVDTI